MGPEQTALMRSYGQFCPIARAAEVLAERWTFLVVRELLFGSRRYNDIRRGLPRMSATLLSSRLKQLEACGVIERCSNPADRSSEYELTEAGRQLRPMIMELAAWGHRWAYDGVQKKDLDAGFLMWSIRRCVRTDALPRDPRTVIHVSFSDRVPLRQWWLVIEAGEVDLCAKDPGHEVDLWLSTDLTTLTQYFDARITLAQARSGGQLRMGGKKSLVAGIGTWLVRPSDQRTHQAASTDRRLGPIG